MTSIAVRIISCEPGKCVCSTDKCTQTKRKFMIVLDEAE